MTLSASIRRFRHGLRVEDLFAGLVAMVFFGYVGIAHASGALRAGGGDTWTVSFIALPMSIIIFLVSLRYAIGSDGTTFSRWAGEVTAIIRD